MYMDSNRARQHSPEPPRPAAPPSHHHHHPHHRPVSVCKGKSQRASPPDRKSPSSPLPPPPPAGGGGGRALSKETCEAPALRTLHLSEAKALRSDENFDTFPQICKAPTSKHLQRQFSSRKGDTEVEDTDAGAEAEADDYKPAFTDFGNFASTLYAGAGVGAGAANESNPYLFDLSHVASKRRDFSNHRHHHSNSRNTPKRMAGTLDSKAHYEREAKRLKAKFATTASSRRPPPAPAELLAQIQIPSFVSFVPFNSIQAQTYATSRRLCSPPSSSQSRRERLQSGAGGGASLKPFRE